MIHVCAQSLDPLLGPSQTPGTTTQASERPFTTSQAQQNQHFSLPEEESKGQQTPTSPQGEEFKMKRLPLIRHYTELQATSQRIQTQYITIVETHNKLVADYYTLQTYALEKDRTLKEEIEKNHRIQALCQSTQELVREREIQIRELEEKSRRMEEAIRQTKEENVKTHAKYRELQREHAEEVKQSLLVKAKYEGEVEKLANLERTYEETTRSMQETIKESTEKNSELICQNRALQYQQAEDAKALMDLREKHEAEVKKSNYFQEKYKSQTQKAADFQKQSEERIQSMQEQIKRFLEENNILESNCQSLQENCLKQAKRCTDLAIQVESKHQSYLKVEQEKAELLHSFETATQSNEEFQLQISTLTSSYQAEIERLNNLNTTLQSYLDTNEETQSILKANFLKKVANWERMVANTEDPS